MQCIGNIDSFFGKYGQQLGLFFYSYIFHVSMYCPLISTSTCSLVVRAFVSCLGSPGFDSQMSQTKDSKLVAPLSNT